jgi:galactokinase
MTQLALSVANLFSRAFHHAPSVISRSPARVEVLGNHTDYNEGYVLSAAIDRYLHVAVSKGKEGDPLRFASSMFDGIVSVIDAKPQKQHAWVNYSLGVWAVLKEKGYPVGPANFAIHSEIPMGAGLSSSAALEVATGLALATLFGFSVPPEEMARICQRAEHEFAGAKCGLLDQFSVLFGKKDHLLFIDFRTLEHQTVPFGSSVALAITPSGVAHALVSSAYNDRRRECFDAAAFFAKSNAAIKTLRDVSWQELLAAEGRFDATSFKRAKHVVGENDRVQKGVGLLRQGKIADFGGLLFESHESSRVNFENSCKELDVLVAIARSIEGTYGSRLSGGGFGGATLSVIPRMQGNAFAGAMVEGYARQTGKSTTVHFAAIADGATVVQIS